jgi:hypothetical protein
MLWRRVRRRYRLRTVVDVHLNDLPLCPDIKQFHFNLTWSSLWQRHIRGHPLSKGHHKQDSSSTKNILLMRIPTNVHQLSDHGSCVGRSLEVGAIAVGPERSRDDCKRRVVVVEIVEDDLVDCLFISSGGGTGRLRLKVCRDGKLRHGITIRDGRPCVPPHGLGQSSLLARLLYVTGGQESGAGEARRKNGCGGGGIGNRAEMGWSNLDRVAKLDVPILGGGGRRAI